MKYVAFLRGINLGPTHKVPMKDLQKVFSDLGFTEVKTLLNSGNVLFSSEETDSSSLEKEIGAYLEKTFGFAIDTLIRRQKEIQEMIEKDPFKNIIITPETRLYVTFLSSAPKSSLKIPYESPEKTFRILRISKNEICSAVFLTPQKGTLDLMSFIEKEFGKNVTTRNWNTVVKLAKL